MVGISLRGFGESSLHTYLPDDSLLHLRRPVIGGDLGTKTCRSLATEAKRSLSFNEATRNLPVLNTATSGALVSGLLIALRLKIPEE